MDPGEAMSAGATTRRGSTMCGCRAIRALTLREPMRIATSIRSAIRSQRTSGKSMCNPTLGCSVVKAAMWPINGGRDNTVGIVTRGAPEGAVVDGMIVRAYHIEDWAGALRQLKGKRGWMAPLGRLSGAFWAARPTERHLIHRDRKTGGRWFGRPSCLPGEPARDQPRLSTGMKSRWAGPV